MSDTYNEQNLLEQELVHAPEQEALEEKVKALQEQREVLQMEIAGLTCKLKQAHTREAHLGKHLRNEWKAREDERHRYEQELQRLREKKKRAVVLPCIVIAVFAILSLLTGLCVDKGWMIALLGELLISAFLCVCSFFGGIVWNRTAK